MTLKSTKVLRLFYGDLRTSSAVCGDLVVADCGGGGEALWRILGNGVPSHCLLSPLMYGEQGGHSAAIYGDSRGCAFPYLIPSSLPFLPLTRTVARARLTVLHTPLHTRRRDAVRPNSLRRARSPGGSRDTARPPWGRRGTFLRFPR